MNGPLSLTLSVYLLTHSQRGNEFKKAHKSIYFSHHFIWSKNKTHPDIIFMSNPAFGTLHITISWSFCKLAHKKTTSWFSPVQGGVTRCTNNVLLIKWNYVYKRNLVDFY